jgi:hypothetical protein
MLGVVGEDGVEDPGESQDRINDHDEIIPPSTFESKNISQTPVPRSRLKKGEIHKQVPESWLMLAQFFASESAQRLTAVNTVDGRKRDKQSQVSRGVM